MSSLICCLSLFLFSRSCTDVVCCVIFIIVILGYIALGTVGKFKALLLITSHTYHNDKQPHTGKNLHMQNASEMFWFNHSLEVWIITSPSSARLYKVKAPAGGMTDNNIPQAKNDLLLSAGCTICRGFFLSFELFIVSCWLKKSPIVKSAEGVKKCSSQRNFLFLKN